MADKDLPQPQVKINEPEQSVQAAPDAAKAKTTVDRSRTKGEYVFDVFLYPFLNNIVVFGISVVATYLTSHGDKVGGGVGKWFHQRGETFKKYAKKTGMNESQADMSKMVAFSFIDGSIMAPFVKMFEDRRHTIARALDKKMGTLPEDESVYDDEPKQSWKSVLLGRAATSAIVVPTAVVLEKAGLNDVMFTKPGQKLGKWFIEKYPHVQKRFSKFDLPELFKVGTFEAFYTSVCTAGLYFSSRMIARFGNNKKKKEEAKIETAGFVASGLAEATDSNTSFVSKYAPSTDRAPIQPKADNYAEQVMHDKSMEKASPHLV